MSKNKKWKTAQELMQELESDPDYLRRRAAKDKELARLEAYYSQLERPIIDSLKQLGYDVDSVEDLVKQFAPLRSEVIEVLLANLNSCIDKQIQESLIRAIGAAELPFDGRKLAQCYDDSDDVLLRWVIINTIAIAHPHSIEDWLQTARRDPSFEKTFRDLTNET